MKKLITLSYLSGGIMCFLLLGVCSISCHKPTDCKVNVSVYNTSTADTTLQPNAVVKLYSSNPPGQVQASEVTNPSGIAGFDFKLPAIFDIAVSINLPGKTLTGKGIVQLQTGQTVTAKVYIQ